MAVLSLSVEDFLYERLGVNRNKKKALNRYYPIQSRGIAFFAYEST
jgi:hypothetical protein